MRVKELFGMGVFYPEGYKREGPKIVFSLKTWKEILNTVGSRTPESGGFLFSWKDYYFIDTFEFDKKGSEKASSVVYSPDVTWANKVHEKHMCNRDRFRVLVGCVHSHPGISYHPSGESGYGLGDLGYVRKFFDYIPYLEEFLLPIVVFPFDNSFPVFVPWICKRNWLGKIKLVLAEEVIVIDASEIPYRGIGKDEKEKRKVEADEERKVKIRPLNKVEATYKTISEEVEDESSTAPTSQGRNPQRCFFG